MSHYFYVLDVFHKTNEKMRLPTSKALTGKLTLTFKFNIFQIGKIGIILTFLYCLLMVPIMMLYRYMELQTSDNVSIISALGVASNARNNRKYPPRYEDSKLRFYCLLFAELDNIRKS